MSHFAINIKDYKGYNPLSPNNLPSRTSFTPRRLFIPALVATLALIGISSLHLTGQSVSSYIGGGAGREPPSNLVAQGEDPWAQVGRPLRVAATVEERLRAWELAPLGEPADWVQQSVKVSCSACVRVGEVSGADRRAPLVLAPPILDTDAVCFAATRPVRRTGSLRIKTNSNWNRATCSGRQ